MSTEAFEPGAVVTVRQRVQRLAATLLIGLLPWFIAPGALQPDTKTDLVLSPGRYLQRALWAWNDHTGVGELQNQAYGYLWPMGSFFLAGDAVGMPGWAVQRLWWTLLLVVAFVGAERLARRVAGLPTIPALLTGAVFALSPRVLTVLSEISVEVWPYALAPWLLLTAHGMIAPHAAAGARRRGAAVTGLLAACLGGVNATVSLVALVPAATWLLLAPRGRSRLRAGCWWLLGALLGSLWWLGPLVVLGRYSYPFLDHIELASTTTAVASVVNSLRGANHWIGYILTAGDSPTWQSGWVLAQSAAAIIATTVLAGLGLAGLLRSRGERPPRERDEGTRHLTRWALVLVLVGVLAMAVGRTGSASGPLAPSVQAWLDGPLAPFRNVHKADLLIRLPLALGVGLLAHWSTRIERGAGPLTRQVVVTTTVLALVGSLAPLWVGRAGDAWAPRGIPASWTEAADEVDVAAAQDGGTTLVLPGARTADFTWGRVTDEPLRALAASPVLARAAAPLGPPGATRILDHVDELVATGRKQPHLAEGLRRLGISRVLVRGGLREDVGAVDSRRVAATLEASPGLTRQWSTGEGQEEISLWTLERPASPAVAIPEDGVVDVMGAPEGWFALAAAGLVDQEGAMRLVGDREDPEIRTDTYRWQALNSGRPPDRGASPTLPAEDRAPVRMGSRDLRPETDGLRASATRFYTGLSGITVSSTAADPFAAAWRGAGEGPAALVDGDPTTRWVSGDGSGRARVTLRLAETSRPTAVLVHEAGGYDLGRFAEVAADGREGTRPEGSMTWRIPLDGSARSEITLEVTGTQRGAGGDAPPLGIREVELEDGPELGTGLRVPEGGAGPVLLTRDPRAGDEIGAGEDPADLVRRVGGLPETSATATVRATPDEAGQDVVSAPWSLRGSTQPDPGQADLTGWPVAALDGDPSTRWTPSSGAAEPVLDIDLGTRQDIERITLDRAAGPVTVATDSARYALPSGRELTIPAQRTRTLSLTFSRPAGRAAWAAPEVSLPGVEEPRGELELECSAAGSVGREEGRIGLALTVDRARLLAGEAVGASPCGNLPKGEGDITAAGVPGLVPETLALVPTGWSPAQVEGSRSVTSRRDHAGRWTVEVGRGEESVLTLSQGSNEGWRAVDGDGRELDPTTVDGWRQGFRVPGGGPRTVTIEFTPNTTHRVALLAGAGAVGLLVLWLLLEALHLRRRPAGTETDEAAGHRPSTEPGAVAEPRRALVVLAAVAALLGLLVGGWVGLVAALLGALVPARLRGLVVGLVLGVAGAALAGLGVADQQSAGAWVSQALGALTLGVLVAALGRPWGGAPTPGRDAPAGSTTGVPDPG